MIVVTANDLPGDRSTAVHAVARGLIVRSRSTLGNIGGSIRDRFGGNLSVDTNLAETVRPEACDLMTRLAETKGANAIIAMRHDANDANDIMDGISEVLAFATAATVQAQRGQAK